MSLLLILVRTDLIMVLRNQVLLNQFNISGYSKTMSDFYICGQIAHFIIKTLIKKLPNFGSFEV